MLRTIKRELEAVADSVAWLVARRAYQTPWAIIRRYEAEPRIGSIGWRKKIKEWTLFVILTIIIVLAMPLMLIWRTFVGMIRYPLMLGAFGLLCLIIDLIRYIPGLLGAGIASLCIAFIWGDVWGKIRGRS